MYENGQENSEKFSVNLMYTFEKINGKFGNICRHFRESPLCNVLRKIFTIGVSGKI